MSLHHTIWKVGMQPVQLEEGRLATEDLLEEMITHRPGILSDKWLLIGRQVPTTHGGKVDLLALNQDAQLIVIELKRDKTPRDVVAQALDYASWAKHLSPDALADIHGRFRSSGSLDQAFKEKFGTDLDAEQLNGSHQIVVVASVLDASTERIVAYLNELGVAINVLFFQVFRIGQEQLLSRAWLIDPVETEATAVSTATGIRGEWNGEYYVSFGHSESRSWDEAVKYGFISAGGGPWYVNTLYQLKKGDRIWVNVPGYGYAGVGIVDGDVTPFEEFTMAANGFLVPFSSVAQADYHRAFTGDSDKKEYFVPIRWLATKPLDEAVREVGLFGNQNTVCKPRVSKWHHTVDRLKAAFNISS